MADPARVDRAIRVEVAYAEPERQWLLEVDLVEGATVAEALVACGIAAEAGVDLAALTTGIWSKPVARDEPLRDGDRVELYRPLQVDPKESRRRRAAKGGRDGR